MRPVLLATCAAHPNGDEDADLLLAALDRQGIAARWAVWDDPAVDWTEALTVLRSTWDYTLRREAFLAWARTVPALVNPVEVVAWNSDKVYLRELEAAGIPITPTTVVPPGSPFDLPGGVEVVLKPSVGAGSRGAGRFLPSAAREAAEHAAALHEAGRTVLVQPYLSGVDEAGETALVYLDGRFSHAIRKGPMLVGDTAHDLDGTTGLFIEENITPREPAPAELEVGDRIAGVIERLFGAPLLYMRVDLLPGPSGPVVVELELTEPSLFLAHGPSAADRLAAAIAARA